MGRFRSKVPRLYFSLRSPYSWMAVRDLVDNYPDVVDRIEWKPYWDPDDSTTARLEAAGGEFAYVAMSPEKHRYVLQDVRRLTTARGLAVTWPMDDEPRWEVPHLAYFVAAEAGQGLEFVLGASRARWQEGRDICDPNTMAEFEVELGIEQGRLSGAVDDPELQGKGTDALLGAYRDGVFGPPFFVHGFDKFWGLERVSLFADSVRRSMPPEIDVIDKIQHPPTLSLSFDMAHPGGCG